MRKALVALSVFALYGCGHSRAPSVDQATPAQPAPLASVAEPGAVPGDLPAAPASPPATDSPPGPAMARPKVAREAGHMGRPAATATAPMKEEQIGRAHV